MRRIESASSRSDSAEPLAHLLLEGFTWSTSMKLRSPDRGSRSRERGDERFQAPTSARPAVGSLVHDLLASCPNAGHPARGIVES